MGQGSWGRVQRRATATDDVRSSEQWPSHQRGTLPRTRSLKPLIALVATCHGGGRGGREEGGRDEGGEKRGMRERDERGEKSGEGRVEREER